MKRTVSCSRIFMIPKDARGTVSWFMGYCFFGRIAKRLPGFETSIKTKIISTALLILSSPWKYFYKPSLTKARQFLQSLWKLNWWDGWAIVSWVTTPFRSLCELRCCYDPFEQSRPSPWILFLFTQKPYEGEGTAIYNTNYKLWLKEFDDFLTPRYSLSLAI